MSGRGTRKAKKSTQPLLIQESIEVRARKELEKMSEATILKEKEDRAAKLKEETQNRLIKEETQISLIKEQLDSYPNPESVDTKYDITLDAFKWIVPEALVAAPEIGTVNVDPILTFIESQEYLIALQLFNLLGYWDTAHDFVRGYRKKKGGVNEALNFLKLAKTIPEFSATATGSKSTLEYIELLEEGIKDPEKTIKMFFLDNNDPNAVPQYINRRDPEFVNTTYTYDDIVGGVGDIPSDVNAIKIIKGDMSIKDVRANHANTIGKFINKFCFQTENAVSYWLRDAPKKAHMFLGAVDSARGLFIPQNISDSATTSLEDLNKINPDICLMPVSPDGGNTFISRANIFTQGLWQWEFQYTAPLTKIMPYTWKYVIRRIGNDEPVAEIQYNSNEKEGPSVNQLLAHHISLGISGRFSTDADPTTKQVILPKGRLNEPGIDTVLRDEIRAGKSLLFDMKRGGDWDVCFANSYIRSSGETYRNTGLMTGDPTAALLNIAMDNATIIDAADYLIIYRSQYTSVALSESKKILLNITKVVRSIATDLMVLALICPDSPGSPPFLQRIAADIFEKINAKADGNFFWNIKLRDIRIYLDKILGLTEISNCEFVTTEMRSVMKECKEKILFLKGKIKDEANTKVRMSIRKMMRAVQNDCVKNFINLLIPEGVESIQNVDFLKTQLDRYNGYYTRISEIIDSLRKDIPHYILHGLMQMYFDSNDFSIDRNLDCLKFNHVNLENITTLWDSIRSSYSEILAIPDTTVSDRSFSFPTYGALVNKIVQYNIELKTFAESLIQQDPNFYMKHRIIIGNVVRVAAVEEVAEIEDVAEDNEIVKDEVASFIEDPTVVAPDQRVVLKNFISNFRELSGTGMYDDNKDITKRIKLNRTQKDALKKEAIGQLREIVRAIRLPAAPAAPMNLSGGGLRGDGLRVDGFMDEDIYNLILSYLSNISQQVNARLSNNPRLLKAYYRAIVNTSSPDELVKFQEDIVRSGNTIEGFIEYMRDPTEEQVVTFTETQDKFPEPDISDIIIYSRNILDALFLDKINYYTALNDTFSLSIINGIHAYLKEYITNETVFEKYFENLKVRGALEEYRRYAELHFQYYRIMALALLFEAINAENKISFFSILFAGGKPNLKPYINVNTEFIKRFLDAAWHVFGAEDKTPYAAYKKSIGPLMMGTGRALGGGRAKTYRRKKSPTHSVSHANTLRASASGRAPRGRRVSRKKQTRRRYTRRNKY